MSKMDQLRALREARYADAVTHVVRRPAVAPETTASRPAPAGSGSGPEADLTDAGERLCGHRSMNGRTCTREHGHAARSHRYS